MASWTGIFLHLTQRSKTIRFQEIDPVESRMYMCKTFSRHFRYNSATEDLHAWSIYRQNLNSDFTDSALGTAEKSQRPFGETSTFAYILGSGIRRENLPEETPILRLQIEEADADFFLNRSLFCSEISAAGVKRAESREVKKKLSTRTSSPKL